MNLPLFGLQERFIIVLQMSILSPIVFFFLRLKQKSLLDYCYSNVLGISLNDSSVVFKQHFCALPVKVTETADGISFAILSTSSSTMNR